MEDIMISRRSHPPPIICHIKLYLYSMCAYAQTWLSTLASTTASHVSSCLKASSNTWLYASVYVHMYALMQQCVGPQLPWNTFLIGWNASSGMRWPCKFNMYKLWWRKLETCVNCGFFLWKVQSNVPLFLPSTMVDVIPLGPCHRGFLWLRKPVRPPCQHERRHGVHGEPDRHQTRHAGRNSSGGSCQRHQQQRHLWDDRGWWWDCVRCDTGQHYESRQGKLPCQDDVCACKFPRFSYTHTQ